MLRFSLFLNFCILHPVCTVCLNETTTGGVTGSVKRLISCQIFWIKMSEIFSPKRSMGLEDIWKTFSPKFLIMSPFKLAFIYRWQMHILYCELPVLSISFTFLRGQVYFMQLFFLTGLHLIMSHSAGRYLLQECLIDEDCGESHYCLYQILTSKCIPCKASHAVSGHNGCISMSSFNPNP